MPQLRFAGGIILVAGLCAACGVVFPAGNAGADGITVPSDPTVINFVDPSQVAGLGTETIEQVSPRIHISYPTFADAPKLNATLRGWLSRLARNERSDAPSATPGRVEFNVDWKLTAATRDVVGVRLRTGEFAGARWADSFHTVWYDGTTGQVHESSDLLRDANALASLAGITASLADAKETGINPDAIKPDATLFDSLDFNSHGDLVVEFDAPQVVPERTARVAIAVPAAQADPLLSDFGRRARAAAKAAIPATPSTAPSVRPSPKPETVAPGIGADCAKVKCLALTFDDGPGPYTSDLLDTLVRHHARATFFALGVSAAAQPYLLKRMHAEGDLIGNHTWSHRDLTTLPPSKTADEITRCENAISQATGTAPMMMRAPYGAIDGQVEAVARRLGLTIVRWDVQPDDLATDDPAAIAKRVIGEARRGAIIMLHDTHGPTVQAMPGVLDALGKEGYAFVTVPELYGSRQVPTGEPHGSGPEESARVSASAVRSGTS
jgi:peptidoglycan/xylan/chitin deacetylase (PgdA/CDA1 family)